MNCTLSSLLKPRVQALSCQECETGRRCHDARHARRDGFFVLNRLSQQGEISPLVMSPKEGSTNNNSNRDNKDNDGYDDPDARIWPNN